MHHFRLVLDMVLASTCHCDFVLMYPDVSAFILKTAAPIRCSYLSCSFSEKLEVWNLAVHATISVKK